MTTPAERAKEFVKMGYDSGTLTASYTLKTSSLVVIADLLASLESVQRDAEVMAEEVLTLHTIDKDTFTNSHFIPSFCNCPACTVARRYMK